MKASYPDMPFNREYVRIIESSHFLLGAYYDGRLGKAILQFVSEDGKKFIRIPDPLNHMPYFLTDENPEALKEKGICNDKAFHGIEEVVKTNPLTMEKIRLTKIIVKDPLAVRKLRSKVTNAWEAKIKYHANYIYDLGLIPGMRYIVKKENGSIKIIRVKPEVPGSLIEKIHEIFNNEPLETRQLAEEFLLIFEEMPPRVNRIAIDIEVYTPFKGRVPNPKLAEYPVISIAFSSNDNFRKVLLLARPFKQRFLYMMEDLKDYPIEAEVEIFDSEKTMLMEAIRIMSTYPVVVTYNGDKFDLVYIYTRALKLGIPRTFLPIRIGEDIVRLETGIHLDLYKFFSNRAVKNYAFGGKYQEEKLESVSSALLGISKVGFEETIGEISASLLIAYNIRDADITIKLTTFNNELVWKLMILLARISKTSIEDICRRQISNWIQNMFFWEHRKLGYLIPNKEDILRIVKSVATKAIIEGKKYAGALVIEPPKGVFFNVMVLDIASLYPSIMKKFNLSYETVDTSWCKNKTTIVDETGRALHYVCKDKPGLTAQIIGILRDFRVEIYKKRAKDKSLPLDILAWYDVVQRAIKVFINASYGVFGDEKFHLYSPAVAESVTALGRRSLMTIVLKATEIGIKTLYGDTDSIFIWSPIKDQLETLQKWIQQNLGLDIEVDKKFRFVIFTGLKKNYLGKTEEGDIDIKGLIAKKRNTPEFLKELFQEMLSNIKKIETPSDFTRFITWLESTIKNYYNGLKQKEITLDKLAIRIALTKDPVSYTKSKPPHVRAALHLRSYGVDIQEGDIITIVKVKGGEGYKAIQLARQHEIDPEKYIELIRTSLEQLLSAFNIKWDDIVMASNSGLRGLLKISRSS
ncbi:MAG: DNA-directed DNA polymerase I [Desulfurococcaceae archaeon]